MRLRFAVPAALMGICAASAAAPPPARPRLAADTYIFSNLCLDGVDLRGHRVVLVLPPTPGTETVAIEFSEFGADVRLHGYRVEMRDGPNRLTFSYQSQNDEYTFVGTVWRDRLTGIFDDDNRTVTLPRVSADAPVKPRCPG